MFSLAVLTVSTSGFHGQREDTSGKAIQEVLAPPGYECVRYDVVSDDREMITDRLTRWSDQDGVDLIVTTGGTGVAPGDITPEACLSVIEREVPGLPGGHEVRDRGNDPHGHVEPFRSRNQGAPP